MRNLYLAIMIGLPAPTYGDTINGNVIKVIDGDTVTILDEQFIRHKIRLTDIDAPERTQAFYKVSKNSLSDLVYNKTISVEFYKLDRNKRILGKIMLGGRDINNEQLKRGMAWYFIRYQSNLKQEDRTLYQASEVLAKAQHAGLWGDPAPVAPWEFRLGKRASRFTNCGTNKCPVKQQLR